MDLEEICKDLELICNRRTSTGSTIDECIKVKGKQLTIKCKKRITKRTVIKSDLLVEKENIYVTNGKDEFSISTENAMQ